MAHIALFHSVLGVRPGVHAAADVLRGAGHQVTVVDQYGGAVFDDYDEAGAFAEGIGYPVLMQRALDAVADLPRDLVAAGFSNGGGMSEWVTAGRPGVRAAVLLSGVLPLARLGGPAWPAGVPAQVHYAVEDPFLDRAGVDAFDAEVAAAGGRVEHHWYPGRGHLFTDASLPDEYDAAATALLWPRVLAFVEAAATASTSPGG